MKIEHLQLVTTPIDLSANWESRPILLANAKAWSAQLFFTGSPIGAFKIQVSNDTVRYQDVAEGASLVTGWTDYSGSSASVSDAGDIHYNIRDAGYRWGKIVYTRSGGSGFLLTANAQLKGG